MRLGTVMSSQGTMKERKEGKSIPTEGLINVSQDLDDTLKTLPYLTLRANPRRRAAAPQCVPHIRNRAGP